MLPMVMVFFIVLIVVRQFVQSAVQSMNFVLHLLQSLPQFARNVVGTLFIETPFAFPPDFFRQFSQAGSLQLLNRFMQAADSCFESSWLIAVAFVIVAGTMIMFAVIMIVDIMPDIAVANAVLVIAVLVIAVLVIAVLVISVVMVAVVMVVIVATQVFVQVFEIETNAAIKRAAIVIFSYMRANDTNFFFYAAIAVRDFLNVDTFSESLHEVLQAAQIQFMMAVFSVFVMFLVPLFGMRTDANSSALIAFVCLVFVFQIDFHFNFVTAAFNHNAAPFFFNDFALFNFAHLVFFCFAFTHFHLTHFRFAFFDHTSFDFTFFAFLLCLSLRDVRTFVGSCVGLNGFQRGTLSILGRDSMAHINQAAGKQHEGRQQQGSQAFHGHFPQ